MARYFLLNLVFLTLAWFVSRRLRDYQPTQAFVLSLVILYLVMVIFNGYLVALPIVRYQAEHILGLRIMGWPIEDVAYLVVALYITPALYRRLLSHYAKPNRALERSHHQTTQPVAKKLSQSPSRRSRNSHR